MNSAFTNRQQARVGGVIQEAVFLLTDPQIDLLGKSLGGGKVGLDDRRSFPD